MNDRNLTLSTSELQAFNEVNEYYDKILQILLSLKPDNLDFDSFSELSEPQYSYASIRATCANEILRFFQAYDSNPHISEEQLSKIPVLNKLTLNTDNKNQSEITSKFIQLRNCLAHGRYTISIKDRLYICYSYRSSKNINWSIFIKRAM